MDKNLEEINRLGNQEVGTREKTARGNKTWEYKKKDLKSKRTAKEKGKQNERRHRGDRRTDLGRDYSDITHLCKKGCKIHMEGTGTQTEDNVKKKGREPQRYMQVGTRSAVCLPRKVSCMLG